MTRPLTRPESTQSRERPPGASPRVISLLKQLQILDKEHDYNQRINEKFGMAFLHDMNWEIERRTLLAKWLRDDGIKGLGFAV